MAAVLVPLPFGREVIPASQKSACRTDPATQQLATPALRSTAAPRAAAFEQPENARIRLPRGRTSTDFEAEKCAEMLSPCSIAWHARRVRASTAMPRSAVVLTVVGRDSKCLLVALRT